MRAVAIDLGGTKLAAAVVDAEGRVLARVKRAVEPRRAAEQIAETAEATLREAGLAWRDVRRAGLIVPGICFHDSGDVWARNLFGQERYPLGHELSLPVDIVIDSDRAGYVLGESWLGAARGLSDVVFLAVGTGIGAGILSGGRLVRGAGDIAGAVGWFVLASEWRPEYRECGCWETEAAGPAVARRAGAASAEEVARAARAGDAGALAALAETARWIGRGAANLISVLNPQMVVLGGGLMQAGDLLLPSIRKEILEWAQPVAAVEARVELTTLGENAGLLGAARLALFDHVR